MIGYVTDKNGTLRLPELMSWRVLRGEGTPCDSFEASFSMTEDIAPRLSKASGFRAEYGGGTVFTGVIDEFRAELGEGGITAMICGRSLAGRLMDNESLPADYKKIRLGDILKRHALSLGITKLDYGETPGADFQVECGMSHWRVITEYAGSMLGLTPRFLADGTLTVRKYVKTPPRHTIDGSSPLVGLTYARKRHGVISEVIVRERGKSGNRFTVRNESFIADGGQAVRVLTSPDKRSYKATRYTGEYQIKMSERNAVYVACTVCGAFAAEPLDTVTVSLPELGVSGDYAVVEAESRCSRAGMFTELKMIRPEFL